jgi:hypothetical protein
LSSGRIIAEISDAIVVHSIFDLHDLNILTCESTDGLRLFRDPWMLRSRCHTGLSESEIFTHKSNASAI